MADPREPHPIPVDSAAKRCERSDADVLAELAAIPPLADEEAPCWDDAEYWARVVDPYLALADVAAQRRLREAVPLLLDRACFGDPGEIMRGLCHALERIVAPDWAELTRLCLPTLSSPRPGTRLWAVHQFARLRDPAAIPALEAATRDEVPRVRQWAEWALERTRG